MRRVFLLVVLAGCAGAPLQSDWERAHAARSVEEEQVALPPYPRAANLVPIDVPDAGGFRFFVDRASLSVGRDGVVRYVLVARSAQGVDNVSFEGLRCATHQYRVYAVGHGNGRWSDNPAPWRTLRGAEVAPARRSLDREYFCVAPLRERGDALAALERRRTGNVGD